MMKAFGCLTLLISILNPSFCFSGEIYGQLFEGKNPVGGIKIEITGAGKTYATVTESSGLYRTYVPEQGQFILTVHHRGKTPALSISSYERPVRYDLILQKTDGDYSLRRR